MSKTSTNQGEVKTPQQDQVTNTNTFVVNNYKPQVSKHQAFGGDCEQNESGILAYIWRDILEKDGKSTNLDRLVEDTYRRLVYNTLKAEEQAKEGRTDFLDSLQAFDGLREAVSSKKIPQRNVLRERIKANGMTFKHFYNVIFMILNCTRMEVTVKVTTENNREIESKVIVNNPSLPDLSREAVVKSNDELNNHKKKGE